MSVEKFNYSSFIGYLEQLCGSGSSGVLYMTCDHNHSARMVLSSGEIISVSYFGKKGNDAVAAMSAVQQCSYRFEASNVVISTDDSLPPTSVIIRNITPVHHVSTPAMASQASMEATIQVPTDTMKKQIKELLLDLVGPMGDFLYSDYVAGAVSKDNIIKSLSSELSGAEMKSVRLILG